FKAIAVAVPARMLNAVLVSGENVPAWLIAWSVYPAPALSMLMSLKVAMCGLPPDGVVWDVVPDNVPPPGLLAIDRTMVRAWPDVTVLPKLSTTATWIAGAIATVAVAADGCTTNRT